MRVTNGWRTTATKVEGDGKARAIAPFSLATCLLATFAYGEFVWYPALQVLHSVLESQPTAVSSLQVAGYERTLVIFSVLVLTSLVLLALSIRSVFLVFFAGEAFIARCKVWLLLLVAIYGLGSLALAITWVIQGRTRGAAYLGRPLPFLNYVLAVSLVVVLAITALSFAIERPSRSSFAMASQILGLAAVLSSLQPTKMAYAYLGPLLLVASWTCVGLWTHRATATAPLPRRDATGSTPGG